MVENGRDDTGEVGRGQMAQALQARVNILLFI